MRQIEDKLQTVVCGAAEWLASLVKALAMQSSNGKQALWTLHGAQDSSSGGSESCGRFASGLPRWPNITRSLSSSPGLWLSDPLTLERVDQVSMVLASLTKREAHSVSAHWLYKLREEAMPPN